MTICIGIKLDDGTAAIITDSCATNGQDAISNIGPAKVMRVQAADKVPIVVASAGKFRFTQALRHYMWWGDAPFIPEDADFNELCIIQHIIPSIKEMSDKHKLHNSEDDPSWMGGNDVLIAVGGNIWHITEAYDLIRVRREFCAIGNGTHTATGALAAMRQYRYPQTAPLLRAVEAARICSEFLIGVLPPFYGYTTRPDDETLHTFDH